MNTSSSLLDIPQLFIGHASDPLNGTGVTVILYPPGATAGMDLRGSATGTRSVDSLDPLHLVPKIHGMVLAGGSSFGLAATSGVLDYLEEHHIGFTYGETTIPIVPGAVIFDLNFKNGRVRPNRAMGYQACIEAFAAKDIPEGSVGAGTGATVGKIGGIGCAMKGGFGCATIKLESGLVIGVLVVVNAFGDIVQPKQRTILAGARQSKDSQNFIDTAQKIADLPEHESLTISTIPQNTTLGVVITNAKLTKTEATRLAQLAISAYAQVISPAFMSVDGDAMFTLATGEIESSVDRLGVLAEMLVTQAIIRAIQKADGLGVIPAYSDIHAESNRKYIHPTPESRD
jgi:L-aminopeptidase/D-esterase-like protein